MPLRMPNMRSLVRKVLACALALVAVAASAGNAICGHRCGCQCYYTCCLPCPCVVVQPCCCCTPPTANGCGTGTEGDQTGTTGNAKNGTNDDNEKSNTSTSDTGTSGTETTGDRGSTTQAEAWTDADVAKVKTALKEKGIADADADKLIEQAKAVTATATDVIDLTTGPVAGDKGKDLIDDIKQFLDGVKAKLNEAHSRLWNRHGHVIVSLRGARRRANHNVAAAAPSARQSPRDFR